MNAQDFMEMNKAKANRNLEESKDRPRSTQHIVWRAVLNFIDAYEMEVGYDVKRQTRGYWENVPLVEDFKYIALHANGEAGVVNDIEKRHIIGVGSTGWDKNEVIELRVRRRNAAELRMNWKE